MPLTAAQIKAWLASTGRTYESFAAELGVSKGTVSQWMMSKNPSPIPEMALKLISRLMQEDGSLPSACATSADRTPAELARIIEINAALLRQKLEDKNSD